MGDYSTPRTRRFKARAAAAADRARQAGIVARAPPTTEADILAALQRYANDPEAFIEENLYVRHIDGGRLVPFTLTVGQRIVVRKLRWHLGLGEAVRFIILKSRRQKISSLCQALAYWYASTRAYVEALTCADKNDLTEEIFELGVKTYYTHDQRKLMDLRPEISASSRRELKFANPDEKTKDEHPGLQSTLRVTSAESKEPGRGGTKHFIHGSEVSYWPEDPPPWQGMGIALSNAPGTIALLEGTANGAGGFFYDTWRAALEGKNEWTPIFLAWWMDPANVAEVTDEERREWRWVKTEEEDEEKYARKWRLSLEQAKWRRQIIASPKCYKPGRSRFDVFRQEYPACESESWLSSSKNFFIPLKVDEWERHPEKGAREPLYHARVVNEGPPLDDRGPGRITPVKPKIERDADGELAVWAERDELEEYAIIVDPAEGITGRDEHAIGVLARNALDFVAMYRSTSLSTREIAHVAALLGWFYGTGIVAVEANNHGGAVLQELLRILYPKLWYHRDVTKPGEDVSGKPGWVQSHALRMYALKLLEAESRTPVLGIHDPAFFDQARHFVWPKNITSDNPKPAAMPGHHDDLVLMVAIALGVHVNSAMARRKEPPKPKADPNEALRPEPMDLSMKHVVERAQKRRIRGRSLWGGTR